jgi:hypothetical protein
LRCQDLHPRTQALFVQLERSSREPTPDTELRGRLGPHGTLSQVGGIRAGAMNDVPAWCRP